MIQKLGSEQITDAGIRGLNRTSPDQAIFKSIEHTGGFKEAQGNNPFLSFPCIVQIGQLID